MEIQFSILMCSRGRPEILETNVTNIKLLATNPDEVQILIGADDDDAPTVAAVKELQDRFINIELVVRPRFKNLHQFYNLLASQAAGKYIWGMNDDSLVEYGDWDLDFSTQIESLIAPYPDRIGYFAISSNSSDTLGDYGEFPIVTREALRTLGFMDCEDTSSWGCDKIVYNIYKSVGRAFRLNVDRPMRHIYHENGSTPNPNRDDMIKIFKEQFGNEWNSAILNMTKFVDELDITKYIERLKEVIDGKAS